MFLKNYTSDVPVSQTIYKIEQVLIRCRVSGITKEYDPRGGVCALRFQIPCATGSVNVRIPVNEASAIDALWLDYADGDKLANDGNSLYWNARKKKKKSDFIEQGKRTAWKIMQDWVEIQMSMIQMKQADTIEVFMPYIWDGKTTLYGRLKDSGYRALLPETTQ